MRALSCLLLVFIPSCAAAPEGAPHHPSPYSGTASDSVRTLSAAEVDDLLSGEGMGLARAAELNGYPGPRHVLDLADSLALTPEQRAATESLFAAMQAEAVAVGREVLEAERALEAAFAASSAEPALRERVERVAERRGALRWVHLRTHLRMRELLTTHQVHAYDRLRGYQDRHHHPGRR